MSDVMKLYSSWFCPFAQRAWIALLAKDIPFELVEIDPYNKTPEFLAVNPRGLVPVYVQHDGRCVYESSVCIEYADELKPGVNALFPNDAWERAHVRIWCDFVSKRIVPAFYKYLMNQNPENSSDLQETLLEHLATFSTAIDNKGPYFMGEHLGMADIMVFPFTYRINLILKHYKGFEIPQTEKYAKLLRLNDACKQHKSIVPTVANEKRLLEKYERYYNNTAETEVADAVRMGGSVLP